MERIQLDKQGQIFHTTCTQIAWRETEGANHFHAFWECSGIQQYRIEIRDSMEKVLGLEIDPCFQIMYLGGKASPASRLF